MAQHIIVTDYNPIWAEMFESEAENIRQILGDNCVAIHHIGSTAVPDLAAKPIIDIMPIVKSLDAVDQVAAEFEVIGYESVSYTHLDVYKRQLLIARSTSDASIWGGHGGRSQVATQKRKDPQH